MMGPSPHLSWKELACKDGTPYPTEFIHDGRAGKLAGAFEQIRNFFGSKPIIVISAYRTKKHNKKIGGAVNSQHLHGRALDLKPPSGVSINSFYSIIKSHVKIWNITGLGKYQTFVHIDIRPSNRVSYWKGSGVKDS